MPRWSLGGPASGWGGPAKVAREPVTPTRGPRLPRPALGSHALALARPPLCALGQGTYPEVHALVYRMGGGAGQFPTAPRLSRATSADPKAPR